MLLTVFGILSWEMVIKDKRATSGHNKAGCISFFSLTTASLRESIVLNIVASILAYNIVAVLLIPFWRYNGQIKGNNLFCYLQLRDSP